MNEPLASGRWIVSGTDTEVGKSVITASLAAGLRAQGHLVRAMKPIASGVAPGEAGEDATLIARGAGHEPLTWARFTQPVSPHRAQQIDRRLDLDVDGLLRWIDAERIVEGATIVEGAGGWRVPLLLRRTGGYLELKDLAEHLDAPVVVVAADKLGVLNHTLLTVEAIRADGCEVQGVVLNRYPASDDASRASNLEDLQTLLDCPVHAFPPVDPTDVASLAKAGQVALSALRMRILRA